VRSRPAIALVAVSVVWATASVASASAAFHWPNHFPTHRCGSFVSEYEGASYKNVVFNSKGLSCRLATEVISAFLDSGEELHHHGGRSSEESWWTTNRFPEWRCFSGAGGGGCLHKHREAGYSVTLL
jgi:hypothetical protein